MKSTREQRQRIIKTRRQLAVDFSHAAEYLSGLMRGKAPRHDLPADVKARVDSLLKKQP